MRSMTVEEFFDQIKFVYIVLSTSGVTDFQDIFGERDGSKLWAEFCRLNRNVANFLSSLNAQQKTDLIDAAESYRRTYEKSVKP